ncbi:hypothetical protein LJC49_04800 [Ruminococcaceae bacterium OttesenSCG-928-I18]|nr:hypothetical protein [Ruminococcaceae bacterium OttesenSCG-928-I18]
MKYDVEFPDMGNYDIENPGEMALYHAHCDFMPFRSVIDTTKASTSALREYYSNLSKEARQQGDYITEDFAMTSGMLYGARAIPLAYSSLLLIMVALLEEAFNTLCRAYCIRCNYQVTYKDIAGQGLERAIIYLEKVADVKGIKSDANWEYVKTIRDARNLVVHNGGRVTGKIDAFEKFGFYIREEDKQIMFEHDDIIRMYEAIMAFMERVFRIAPVNS